MGKTGSEAQPGPVHQNLQALLKAMKVVFVEEVQEHCLWEHSAEGF